MTKEDTMYENLCSTELLYRAWLKVEGKDSLGGLDRQSINDFRLAADKNIEDLSNELRMRKYVQQPYREVFIPKKENEKRRLGLLSIRDKIVQTAVYLLLSPLFERSSLKVSYAYRENKGPVKAIRQVRHLIRNGKFSWLASCDIDNFFDTIPHEHLFRKLNAFIKSPGITELIKMFITMGSVNFRNKWKDSIQGIPQGGVISPLLANFYLQPLDKMITDHNYGYVRYADDFIILAYTESEAKKALDIATNVIVEKLHLKLNTGSEVVHTSNGFEFLGIYFKDKDLSLSQKKYYRLVDKMADSAGAGQGLITKKFSETIEGIRAFYGKLIPSSILYDLDTEIVKILKDRFEKLNLKNSDKTGLYGELQSIKFLSDSNNFNKTAFLQAHLEINKQASTEFTPSSKKNRVIKSREAVLIRKREYKKIESSGFDLLVSRPGITIGKKEKSVILRKSGETLQEIPFLNLKQITILNDGVSLSYNLIRECCELKISIHFLDFNGMPYAQIYSPLFFDAEIANAQTFAYMDNKCFDLVRQFISGKINNQVNLMKYFGKYRAKLNPEWSSKLDEFERFVDKSLDKSQKMENCDLDEFRLKMFAIEGQVSAKYWDLVKLLIEKNTDFAGRERQGATDLINCMLNYGYGILYSRVTEGIIKARLNPCLSYLHKPYKNRPSLVFDLIEEFRQQAVDRVVVSIANKYTKLKSENGLLDQYTKKLLSKKIIERLNNHEKFRNSELRLGEIIQIQANALADYLTGKTHKYKPYKAKW